MQSINRRRALQSMAAVGLAGLGVPVRAQSRKLARIVVPFPAGGGTDAAARALAEHIRGHFPGGLIVDNRPGAAGRIGIESVKAAEPDGLTMMYVPDFVLTIYPHTYKQLKYDPAADFTPVAQCTRSSYVVTAGPGLPSSIQTMRQLVDWWKANPKQATVANNSAGSPTHFIAVMIAKNTGVELTHVSYRGGAPALQDLLAGQVPVSINPVGEVMPHVKGGKLRLIACTAAQRDPFVPDVPTLSEAGFSGLSAASWLGLLMPAKVPHEIVQPLAQAIDVAAQKAELRNMFATFAMDTMRSTPSGMAVSIKSELARWGEIVKASGFDPME